MLTEDNKTLVQQSFEGFNQRNLAVFNELCIPDLAFHNASAIIKGLEASMQVLTVLLTAFPDVRFTVEDIIAEGDKIVARYTLHGSHQGDFMGIAPTGKQFTVTGIEIFRFVNGKVVEEWVNGDDLGLLQQLGVIPTSEQTSE